jgi:hypothetical protein
VAAEVAEHATLDNVLQLEPVLGLQEGALVEADLPISVPSEHAIEHDEVEVKMRVEAGSEAMKEAQSPELSVVGCTRAGVAQGRTDGTDEDPQDRAGDVRVALQEGT